MAAGDTSIRGKWRGIAGTVFAVAAFLLLIALLLPLLSPATAARLRTECATDLRQLALAMSAYHQEHGSLPPAYLPDESGRPVHSWRVLVLPYLGEEDKELYAQYRFDEPWYGPHNRLLADKMPASFACPADHDAHLSTWMTSYVVLVGEETPFPGAEARTLEEITDGPENTVLLVEMADSGINWLEPRDLTYSEMGEAPNDASALGVSSDHPNGANAVFADAHVTYLNNQIDRDVFKALLTATGGEVIPPGF